MAKRENGEGSIYKRKDIKRRPWVVALPASYSLDEQGKMIKKQEILGHYASSKEAKAALAHYLEHPVVEINMTVDDLHTLWLSRPARSIKTYPNSPGIATTPPGRRFPKM